MKTFCFSPCPCPRPLTFSMEPPPSGYSTLMKRVCPVVLAEDRAECSSLSWVPCEQEQAMVMAGAGHARLLRALSLGNAGVCWLLDVSPGLEMFRLKQGQDFQMVMSSYPPTERLGRQMWVGEHSLRPGREETGRELRRQMETWEPSKPTSQAAFESSALVFQNLLGKPPLPSCQLLFSTWHQRA